MTMTLPRVSRRDNPETSKAAEVKVTQSGKRQSQINQIVGLLRFTTARGDGLEFGQIARWLALTEEQAKKRLTDCRNMGLATQEGTVNINGYDRGLWYAVPDAVPVKKVKRVKVPTLCDDCSSFDEAVALLRRWRACTSWIASDFELFQDTRKFLERLQSPLRP